MSAQNGLARGQQKRALIRQLTRSAHPAYRVIYFPHAGAGAVTARPFVGYSPADCELHVVQLPGREDRYAEAPFGSVHEAASEVVANLVHLASLPTVLFGHSMGAVLAFETARRMQGILDLRALVVSGHNAPRAPRSLRNWAKLRDQALVSLLRQLGGMQESLLANEELMRLMLPVLRQDLAMLDDYKYLPAARLRAPILALGGNDDVETAPELLDDWRKETASSFQSEMFSGGHFFLFSNLRAIMESIVAVVSASIDLVSASGQDDS